MRRMVFLPLLALAALLPVPQAPSVAVDLVNPAPLARRDIALVSVPFAPGELKSPAAAPAGPFAVAVTPSDPPAEPTPAVAPALPMLRWPDGSIALLQVALQETVAASATHRVVVTPRRDGDGCAEPWPPTSPRPLLREPLPLWTEVADPWGRVFRAELVADPTAGPDGVLADSGRHRVRRFRAAHRATAAGDAARPFLDLRAYLVTFDGERRAELTLVLDNESPSSGPLGPVRFRSFRLVTADDALRFLPAFAGENVLPPPTHRRDGGFEQWLLPPQPDLYLGDGTAKAFRVHLFQDDAGVDDAARAAAAWAPVRTVAFADLDAVRRSRAFAAHGGPAPRVGAELGAANRQLLLWQQGAALGPFSGFGDPENGAVGGAPRHGDALLHNVLRWRSPELAAVAEAMVLQHSLRSVGGRPPRLPADTAAYRDGLPPTAISAPHGYPPIDYEHVSAHLVFDWWWLTGDAFARDELARLGRAVPDLLATAEFRTARGEGNALLAGVLCARATGDRELLARLLDHALERLAPALRPNGSTMVLPQPPHPLVLDGKTAFDAPYQQAQLVRGLAALHAATGDPRLLAPLARVADVMAAAGWLEGVGPKTFVSDADAGRYTMAASPEDRSGLDRMVIGGLVLAAELAGDPATAERLWSRADFLLDRELPVGAGLPARLLAAANPWLQIALDRRRSP